ncbi:MucR family transcriptional regulator [Devosia sp. ZB163]|uniref:MucR family transcriptional regulator n=1 Tax=Devosia sp. ZB163 TaxID=3025938 RepID=UPI002360B90C|nr:MucR family transcriptional regulator [Devosia sp. ZB163]MDC9825106.1 MucR family transcriptional regulator [Devosia sp. ZB163]
MESGTSNLAAAAAVSEARSSQLVELSADIVSAYVSHNALSASDLPKLIASVHSALTGLGGVVEPEVVVELKPAVPVKRSITPEYLICLEDGKKFKSLKRHLRTEYDMSPEEYRAKWGLPPDYPMVAPTYSEARSRLAKTIGLGRKPKATSSRGRAKVVA